MQILNLKGTQLSASRFPERSSAYVCDVCGRNITRHLNRGHAHAGTLIGPSWYVCRCGHRYLSGAAEWNQLHTWERRDRIREMFLSTLLMLLTVCASLWAAHYAIERGSLLSFSLFFLTVFPAVLAIVLFVIVVLLPGTEIMASMVRSRLR